MVRYRRAFEWPCGAGVCMLRLGAEPLSIRLECRWHDSACIERPLTSTRWGLTRQICAGGIGRSRRVGHRAGDTTREHGSCARGARWRGGDTRASGAPVLTIDSCGGGSATALIAGVGAAESCGGGSVTALVAGVGGGSDSCGGGSATALEHPGSARGPESAGLATGTGSCDVVLVVIEQPIIQRHGIEQPIIGPIIGRLGSGRRHRITPRP